MLLRKSRNSQSVTSFTEIFSICLRILANKAGTKNTAAALNISYDTLHKIHGTRFLNHWCRGFKNLLHNWSVLITGFENVLANDHGSSRDTRIKIKEILIKLKSYSFLCKLTLYLDILEAVDPLSLIFEKNLLSHGIFPAVNKTFKFRRPT